MRIGLSNAVFVIITLFLLPKAVVAQEWRVNLNGFVEFVICVTDGSGNPVPFANVDVVSGVLANSGYHNHHDSQRPKGTVAPTSNTTGPDGCTPAERFDASDVAGFHTIWAFGHLGGTGSQSVTVMHEVDLVELPNHPDLFKTGIQPEHQIPFWGTNNAISQIQSIAFQFRQETGIMTGVNDMSLPMGGRFDLGPGYGGSFWSPPHSAHMQGLNADIPYQYLGSTEQRERWRQIAVEHGANPLPEGNHYHLRFTI